MDGEGMDESRDGGDVTALKETIGRWLTLDREQQMEVWQNVGFDLFLAIAKLADVLSKQVEEQDRRLAELESR
jgi:hypothetical protein